MAILWDTEKNMSMLCFRLNVGGVRRARAELARSIYPQWQCSHAGLYSCTTYFGNCVGVERSQTVDPMHFPLSSDIPCHRAYPGSSRMASSAMCQKSLNRPRWRKAMREGQRGLREFEQARRQCHRHCQRIGKAPACLPATWNCPAVHVTAHHVPHALFHVYVCSYSIRITRRATLLALYPTTSRQNIIGLEGLESRWMRQHTRPEQHYQLCCDARSGS